MFAFHAIGRQDETFLKSDEERLKDFRSRLQYLARGVQAYIKKLKEVLAKPAPGTSHEDRQIKQIALRTNENIQTMIRDLFHSPPIYKANITLSFKPKQDKAKDAGGPKPGQKRKPITFTKAEGGGGGGAGGKRRALYMDTVSGGGAGRSYNKPHVSSYKPPGKQARPSGHYAPRPAASSRARSGTGAAPGATTEHRPSTEPTRYILISYDNQGTGKCSVLIPFSGDTRGEP